MQVLLLSLLFTGYLVNIAAVTPVLQWVHYLSVFFFGFEGLIVNEMSGLNLVFQVRSLSWPAQAIRHLTCAPWTPPISPELQWFLVGQLPPLAAECNIAVQVVG